MLLLTRLNIFKCHNYNWVLPMCSPVETPQYHIAFLTSQSQKKTVLIVYSVEYYLEEIIIHILINYSTGVIVEKYLWSFTSYCTSLESRNNKNTHLHTHDISNSISLALKNTSLIKEVICDEHLGISFPNQCKKISQEQIVNPCNLIY